ncbi:hypothetical protein DA2_3578 [Desulfovibrio sp. A2]|nr:hypothetical protein DA2_3578 [Desulfovibrio sp. A2]
MRCAVRAMPGRRFCRRATRRVARETSGCGGPANVGQRG